MIPNLIQTLLAGKPLEPAALESALHAIMRGEAEAVQVAGLLVALAARPLEARTLAAAARVLRSHRVAIHPNVRPLVDTCGTGGDGAQTFNISTATAMVVAAAGGAVAKHGNRGVSSPVGSADVLEAAGCAIDLTADEVRGLLDATGFAFLFAPRFHPAMANVAPVRRTLGVRTVFNLLGPLANPALAECQLLGVYDARLTEVMAQALRELGSRSALVVHCEGLDEIGLHGVTVGHRLRDGAIAAFRLDPADLGLARAPIEALRGGDARRNVELLRGALAGESGPGTDVVALNAAAALEVAGLAPDVRAGLELARAQIRSGAAARVLERYAESTQRIVAERAG
jgi:anthranilate phosphoribosyltransferase